MTTMAGVTPTVQNSGLPAPSGNPDPGAAAPAAAKPGQTPDPAAAPAPAPAADPATELSTSPVNADAAASAQQQAAAQAEAAKQAEPAPATPAPVVIDTGNEAFNQVGQLLAQKGVGNASDILAEAAKGEVSLASKAALVEALGPEVANLALNQLDSELTRQREAGATEATRQKDYIGKALGLEGDAAAQAWEQLKAFTLSAESGYSDADRQALDDMLAAGGVKAEWAINEAIGRYKQSESYKKVPGLLSGDGPTQAGFEPLSKRDYAEQVREMAQKHGYNSKQVQALQQRRIESARRGF